MNLITWPKVVIAVVILSLQLTIKAEGDFQLLVDDGPYIDIQQTQYVAHWLCKNKRYTQPFSVNESITSKHCSLPSVNVHSLMQNNISYSGDFSVAAMSDFHGQYQLTLDILRNSNIIDQNNNWAFGNGHFVITGDIFDRGDKVTELLWFVYHLEKQAELAGGKVHLLLGNHEVMVLNGDLRYLHPKYQKVSELLNRPFEQLFTPNTVLGQWLRNKPVLVKINDMLFAHGGFHPNLAKEARSLEDINNVFKQSLVKRELATPRSGWAKQLHETNGPIWYRGYFKDNGANEQEIDLLLKHFDIDHIIVGHTSFAQIETRFQGKVIAIDSSIKKGKYGELLLIDNRQMYRITKAGQRQPLQQ
ncbi:metallophosphoesterase [Thalassotalea atypica]|uniref:metallophosphoesterase n=1 Tax=Thalassotalea atypica TaxID=2054316 RepID=UPI0025742349|nr:metallophosphoesterase [Thalassotalea atypica]